MFAFEQKENKKSYAVKVYSANKELADADEEMWSWLNY